MPYGYRLWIEGVSGSHMREVLNSTSAVCNLVKEVIKKAGMTLAAGPLTYREPVRDIGKGPGVTCVAILVESSVHVHTYPEQDFYFFELFSCNQFDHDKIIDAVADFMGKRDLEADYVPVGDAFPAA